MIINHNISALNTYRQLTVNGANAQKSIEKLSSGLRINRAGDDAAGLAISEKMRGQIRGLEQASRNAQDSISLIQTAEGALNETHSILQRMRELAVQSSNDTATDSDRAELQKEIAQLKSEIDRIRDTTEFNTKKLLNGDVGVKTSLDATNAAKIQSVTVNDDTLADDQYQVALSAGALTTVTTLESSSITGFTAADGNFDLTNGNTDNLSFGTYTLVSVKNSADSFDLVLKDSNGKEVASVYGANWAGEAPVVLQGAGGVKLTLAQNANATSGEAKFSIEATVGTAGALTIKANNGNGATLYSNAANAKTINGKLDAGEFTIEFNIESVQASTAATDAVNSTITVNNDAMTFQIGANEGQTTKLGISDMSTTALDIDDIDVSNLTGAQTAVTKIQSAIDKVSAERSKLGAYQNRLEHTISNLGTSAENLTAAESRIRDVDMAKEMMEFTKNNILQQAAQAMLAQANQQPQGVLQLLR